jgi:ATP-dependent RNA helicase SUPV3L1/SUV3
LVTIPVDAGAPEGADTMSGYRNAGSRAIRIDMLERLADMLRAEDSRGGFEAKPDMLSITGMTLEQFSELMTGLGYKAEKGERAKVKTVTEVMPQAAKDVPADTPVMDVAAEAAEGAITDAPKPPEPADTPAEVAAIIDEGNAPIIEEAARTQEVDDNIPDVAENENPQGTAPDAEIAGAEMEVFYTFTWGRAPRANQNQRPGGDRPQGKGKPQGKGRKGAARGDKGDKAKTFSAKPKRHEKPIDPDNPFAAALMGLKDNK